MLLIIITHWIVLVTKRINIHCLCTTKTYWALHWQCYPANKSLPQQCISTTRNYRAIQWLVRTTSMQFEQLRPSLGLQGYPVNQLVSSPLSFFFVFVPFRILWKFTELNRNDSFRVHYQLSPDQLCVWSKSQLRVTIIMFLL